MEKRDKLILTAGPSITQKEISYVQDAIQNGWNEHWNDYIIKFENKFAEYIGVKHALTTSSCTGAMHLGLKSMGLQLGDEVIVPEITWVATASSVTYVNANPIFVDIDPETWCIDPTSIQNSITSKTKAIMPVHLYGHPADMEKIYEIAHEHDLLIFEDAAQSIGTTFKNKKTGSFGNASAFSFQGAKILSTGEGGMFLTDDTELFEKVSKLGDHGRSLTKSLWNDEIGFKYKMSNLQAAMGLAQLERIEELIEKKRMIYSWYHKRLNSIEDISLNVEKNNSRNIFWMTTIVLGEKLKIDRDEFIQKLKQWNIDSRPVFYPISNMPMFKTKHNPNAEFFSKNGINLPSGHNLVEEEVEYICDIIKMVLKEKL